MYTLGINAVFHDSAACLVQDGIVLAAAEEERFTHIKHGKRPIPFSTYELPYHAIDFCLHEAGIRLSEVDHIAYSFDPQLLRAQCPSAAMILPDETDLESGLEGWQSPWDPLFLNAVQHAPGHLADGVPHHLEKRFQGIRRNGPFRWHSVPHHLAHAASAFLPSPFDRAAVMTLDGRGEMASTSYSYGEGAQLELLGLVNMPHSLGILYESVTDYLGFLHSSDEYKVMALASYGRPVYLHEFRQMVLVREHGQYLVAQPLDRRSLEDRFGPARRRGEPLQRRHYDLARSLQTVLEETVLDLSLWLHDATRTDSLCLAGGVALNCVMNGRLREHGPFKHIWVQPAAGDAGTALGAALWVDADERRDGKRSYQMDHAFLGPSFSDEEIEQFLRWSKLPYRRMENIAEETAGLLAEEKIIGWFQGRMEFGPRALGGRSILASPLSNMMQSRLNDLKDREDFRPVAPVVIEEEASHWFKHAGVSPFMLFVFDLLPEKADRIPAARHVDGTARIQTINRAQNPAYYDLLKAFQRKTGVPILVNTSFNTRGEPIVCTPRDAIESFWTSPLDALAIGSFLLEKP